MKAIAIVGMGCRFAGAPDLHSYWKLNVEGRDAFRPVPADRWPADVFFDTNRRRPDKAYAPVGGFVDDVRSFPALTLGLPPRRVEVMDPQQRLSLELSLQAIEDAGLRPSDLPHRTGVYMGLTAYEYKSVLNLRQIAMLMASGQFGDAGDDPEVFARAVNRVVPPRPYTAPGSLANMTAAAVCQELDLHGPAYTIDAACASGLVAIADAVGQLRAGTIDAALAGGAYVSINPDHFVAFSRIGAISGQGLCLPFDERADGFVQGDGGGVLLLKRLEDAERDGDRIYAVIQGASFNNDGHGDGPMAPVPSGQTEVIRDAWADAGLSPKHLGYLEAHGTGTTVGDASELKSVRDAIGDQVLDVALGSSKANVGHTMSAAGVAGIMRAVLALHHQQIPPMAHFQSAKPELELDSSAFHVPKAPVPWRGAERLAAVSSFGFGGTNVHMVLSGVSKAPPIEAQPELLTMSGPDEGKLRDLAARTAQAVADDPSITVAGVVRAWAKRRPLDARVGIVAATRDELVEKLQAFGRGETPEGVQFGLATHEQPKVAFLYPGQGSQRVGMLTDIRARFPVVRDTLDAVSASLNGVLPVPVTALFYPELRSSPVSPEQAEKELTDTANCQPALLTAGVALTELLARVGVEPTVVVGHSLGEFTAAAVAGVLSATDAATFVARRGAAMAELQGDHGAMAAIMDEPGVVEGLLVDGAVIANVNHPRQVVISGSTEAVAQVVAKADAADIIAKPLTVSHGFHSPVLAALDSTPLLDGIALHDPKIPVASGIDAEPYRDAAHARQVFLRHATSPVQFVRALEQCVEAGADLFLQVGAGGPLASFARGSLAPDRRRVYTLASVDDHDGGRSLLDNLARLWVAGVNLNPAAIAAEAPVASVPPQVLPREVYWAVADRKQQSVGMEGIAGAPATVAVEAPEPEPEVDDTSAHDAIEDRVLAVVAKVSAYPRSAVRVGMTLVEDLGFDSLMVGDLATGLAEAFPGLGGIPQELLINRPTVQDLVDYVEGAGREGAAEHNDDAPLHSYTPVWRTAPLPNLPGRTPKGNVLVVGEDSLTAAFTAAGFTSKGGKADLIVYAAPKGEPTRVRDVLAGEAAWPDLADGLIRVLDEQVRLGATPDLLVAMRHDDPWAEALAGVARSVGRELPKALGKAIRFSGDYDANALIGEWASADRSVDVLYEGRARQVRGFERAQADRVLWTPNADDTILITGGTRGIGAALAARLSESGATLLLVGRSDPAPEAQALLDARKAEHLRIDVTDAAALTAAVHDRGVTALVHSAGILADGPLASVDAELGKKARAVKVDGWLAAFAACGPTLQVALGIGSWAGRFGSRHQAHYAAANALLAAISEESPVKVRSVIGEFGPWTSSDMVRTIPAPVQQAMRAEGVDFVSDAAGLDALLNDLQRHGGPQVHGRALPWTTRALRFTQTISTETHPYLLDHAIEGTPILPLAAAADLLALGSQQVAPFVLEDLKLFTGIRVTEPVRLTTVIDGEKAELRLGAKETLAYRARVHPLMNAIDDPGPPQGGEPPTLPLAEFYRDVTFHGPLLQGIECIDKVGPDFVTGRLHTGVPAEWMPGTDRTSFTIDPLVLDSAMQLSAYVAWTRYGRAGTPVSIGRYTQLMPLPPGEILAEVRFNEPADDRSSGTIRLRSLDGTLLALATDVVAELRKVEGDDEPAFEVKPEWVDPSKMQVVKDLMLRLEGAKAVGLRNPFFHVHEGTARDTTVVAGRELVNFSSYNYLGLSGDPRVLADVKAAVDRYGTSVSASRVASGERPFHQDLERELAAAQGAEDALVYTAGHATNVTTIGHLMGADDLILHDELIHDSALQGIKLSGAARRQFKHDDPADLERQLKELRRHYKKVLIAVEGVYSMDGDVCDLPSYVRLKEKYGCLLFVDEAHSFGIIGASGRGVAEHFGIDGGKVDLWMGTLSKSLASCGGWIAGRRDLVTYMRYTAPGFVYSAGITAANGVAALSSLRLMLEEPWRVHKLQENAKFFHAELTRQGIDTGPAHGESGVVPAVTGNSFHALHLSQRLADQGINVQPIVYPAVADDAARLRFFLSSTHSKEQLAFTAKAVAETLAAVRAEFQI